MDREDRPADPASLVRSLFSEPLAHRRGFWSPTLVRCSEKSQGEVTRLPTSAISVNAPRVFLSGGASNLVKARSSWASSFVPQTKRATRWVALDWLDICARASAHTTQRGLTAARSDATGVGSAWNVEVLTVISIMSWLVAVGQNRPLIRQWQEFHGEVSGLAPNPLLREHRSIAEMRTSARRAGRAPRAGRGARRDPSDCRGGGRR